MNISKRRCFLGSLLAICVLILDRITKLWILGNKDKPETVLIKNILEFQYAENRGVAFGALSGANSWIIIFFSCVMVAFLVFLYRKVLQGEKMKKLQIDTVILLVIAGALGNLIDRIQYGFVVDFIYIRIINFPNFNIADMSIVISMIWILICGFFFLKDEDFSMFETKAEKGSKAEEETK